MSRYYNPTIGRFVNLDAYASTGQEILGYNMYLYCGNNPVNRVDYSGTLWSSIKNVFVNSYNNLKIWVEKTFGFESTTVTEYNKEHVFIKEPYPFTVSTGLSEKTIISKNYDCSNNVCAYSEYNISQPYKSYVGTKTNIYNYSVDISVGFDNIAISRSWYGNNQTTSSAFKLDIAQLKIGYEYSREIRWDNTVHTDYTNVSINGMGLFFVFSLMSGGLCSPQLAW